MPVTPVTLSSAAMFTHLALLHRLQLSQKLGPLAGERLTPGLSSAPLTQTAPLLDDAACDAHEEKEVGVAM